MTYVALGQLAVVLLLVVFLFRLQREHVGVLERLEKLHREERFELQERIRIPERKPQPVLTPPRKRGDGDDRPSDLKAMARIGTVVPLRDNESGSES